MADRITQTSEPGQAPHRFKASRHLRDCCTVCGEPRGEHATLAGGTQRSEPSSSWCPACERVIEKRVSEGWRCHGTGLVAHDPVPLVPVPAESPATHDEQGSPSKYDHDFGAGVVRESLRDDLPSCPACGSDSPGHRAHWLGCMNGALAERARIMADLTARGQGSGYLAIACAAAARYLRSREGEPPS